MSLLAQVLVFFAAIVVAVPLSRRLGLGSVLGYLVAGAVIGPYGAALIPDAESTLHFAELGVVLLLFAIGLELQPSRLWALRGPVFGLGGLQVAGTTLAFMLGGRALGLGWTAAAIVGFGLSMSSTALVLQLLGERHENGSAHGKAAFGVLLFQDLAVVPLLALLPQAGAPVETGPAPWWSWLKVPAVLLLLLFGGRFVVRPALRRVAAVKVPEVFTAAALLVVVGTALFVSKIGLSMALGAFLAGVLLSDSEYRHELEADLEPFKGLLLGLFFTAVGMNANLWLLLLKPGPVFGLVVAVVLVKAAVLFTIGRWRLEGRDAAASLAVALSQGGEFAFVLFGLAEGGHLLDAPTAELLTVVVTLSMVTTPLLLGQYVKRVRPRLEAPQREFDVAPDEENPVLIAGMGRVGQVVARVLRGKRIGFTALDINSEHIDFMKRFGNKVFFGDASRVELLRAAKAEEARVFVLAIDDMEASIRTAEVVKKNFPHLRIFARARNRQHVYRLLELGITDFIRETWDASLVLTEGVLQALGATPETAHRSVTQFAAHDVALLMEAASHQTDLKKLTEIAARGRAELEQLFEKDAADTAKG